VAGQSPVVGQGASLAHRCRASRLPVACGTTDGPHIAAARLTGRFPKRTVAISAPLGGRQDTSSRRITGIVFVALATAIVILSGDGDFSRDDAALQDFFVNDTRQAQAFTAVVLLPLATTAPLLWFVAGIRALLRAGDAGGGMLPSAAALGGSVFAATFLVGMTTSNSVTAALAFTDAYQFDAGIARLTLILGIILTTASLAGAAVLVVPRRWPASAAGFCPRGSPAPATSSRSSRCSACCSSPGRSPWSGSGS
jgi:hypothetical protein